MLRDNRLVDFSPKSNVDCCDVVSRPSEAAGLTSKFISGRSVSLRYIPTRGAGSGSVSRVNKDHRNTGNLGFVVYEHSEQSKIPGMQAATLSLSNRNSVSNALKIFKCNRPQSVFGLRNKLLGNAMVNILGESSRPAGKLLQVALGRFGSFGLKPGFQRIKSLSGLADLLTGMHFSIRIDSKVLDAEVNSKGSFRVVRSLFVNLYNYAKVEDSVNQDQISLSSDSVKPCFLVFSEFNGNGLSALQRDQRNFLKSFPGEDTLIIDDSTIKTELWLNGLVSLVGFADLGNGPNRKLGGKTKLISNWIVNRLVDLNLVGTMQSKNSLCYVVARLVKPLHCFAEHLMLLRGGTELNHQGLKHSTECYIQGIDTFGTQQKYSWSVPNSSHPLKGVGLLGAFL